MDRLVSGEARMMRKKVWVGKEKAGYEVTRMRSSWSELGQREQVRRFSAKV